MKNDYPKIDIYVNNTYYCSTTWAKTCKEAIQIYKNCHNNIGKISAHFSKGLGA